MTLHFVWLRQASAPVQMPLISDVRRRLNRIQIRLEYRYSFQLSFDRGFGLEVLFWASAIVLSIFLVGIIVRQYFGHSGSTIAVTGVAGAWIVWTLGFSVFVVGYALSGLLLGFQLGLIAAAWLTYFFVSRYNYRQKARADEAEEYNKQLRRQISTLAEDYEELKGADLPQVVAVVHGAHDHRAELVRTISKANHRLIILSGWVSGYALEKTIKKCLLKALKRGVSVQIGWGYRKKDEPPKPANSTEKWLADMASKYPGRFRIKYFRNHSKLLVGDDSYAIIGSFNWLSNMGNSENDELSLVIADSTYVNALADAAESRFTQGQ